ncbi:hypothetical protein PINS_up018471 [Pythium insidiosum]|nr:hypothetical protein PINS_up018471 [Pythium insidiosum]
MVKTSLLLAATAVLLANTFSSADAQSCFDQRDGAPCQTSSGAPSRCYKKSCRELPKPCAPGAAELQSCGRDEYCSPFMSPELMCLDKNEFPRFRAFDACRDKPDNTPCQSPLFEGKNGGSAALYDTPGTCHDGFCMPPYTAACLDKKNGDTCTYRSVLSGSTREFSGRCKQEGIMLASCEDSSSTELGRATPIKAFDNRDGAPRVTNASAIDICDVLVDGVPCTDRDGRASRCVDDKCLSAPEPCPAGAKELQTCGARGDSICVAFGDDKSTLKCVRPSALTATLLFDACEGKKDGDDCQGVVFETPNKRPTLYEAVGSKCKRHRCMPSGIIVCQGKFQTACSFQDVKDGEVLRFMGLCVKEPGMEPTCAGTASTPKDKVSDAKVLKQAPAQPTPSPVPSPSSTPFSLRDGASKPPVVTLAPGASSSSSRVAMASAGVALASMVLVSTL